MRLARISFSPRYEMVESAGNAPASACLQGRCIACLPRPHANWHTALVLPQANGVLETRLRKLALGVFGDWCGCRESHPDVLPGEEPFCC